MRQYDDNNNLTHAYSEARAKPMEGNISMDKKVKNLWYQMPKTEEPSQSLSYGRL